MPIFLGALAALFIGISDTFGRASSRRADSVSHVSMMMFIGAIVALPLTVVFSSSFIAVDVLNGAIAGVLLAIGLSIVYRAMADSSSALAAPVGGVCAAVIPLVWDAANGADLSALTILGCLVALGALVFVTYNPKLGMGTVRSGIKLAVIGGAFFGVSIIFAGGTSEASGVWPVVSQRAVGFAAMAILATRRGVPIFLPPAIRHFGILSGIAGAMGMSALIVGAQRGDLGTVSVVASMYPAVIVVLATLFDDDEIRWWQGIGVGGAILGTALIALG